MMRLVRLDELEIARERLITEGDRVGLNLRTEIGGMAASLRAGDRLLMEDHDPRTIVWVHREPADPPGVVWVTQFYCESMRLLDLFIEATDFLLERGLTTAKFHTAMTYGKRAAQLTGATVDPDTGVATVLLLQAKARLAAVKAAIEARAR